MLTELQEKAILRIKYYIDFYLENDDEQTKKNLVKFRIIQSDKTALQEMAQQLIDFCNNSTWDDAEINYKIDELLKNRNINIETYTLKDYLKKVSVTAKGINDWEDLSEALNYYTDGNLWAYPIEEYNYCIEENKNICGVVIDYETQTLALAELS